jgi:hypothetical protein
VARQVGREPIFFRTLQRVACQDEGTQRFGVEATQIDPAAVAFADECREVLGKGTIG